MHKGFQKYWSKLKAVFYLWLAVSVLLPILSGVLLLLTVQNFAELTIPIEFWIVYLFSIVGLILLWNSQIRWTSLSIINYLHEKYPEFEYSLSIYFKNDVNPVEKLQQKKVIQLLPKISNFSFPFYLKRRFIVLIISILVYGASLVFPLSNFNGDQVSSGQREMKDLAVIAKEAPIKSFEYHLRVYPPNYTNLKSYQWKKDQKIPEGSLLVFSNKGDFDFDLMWQNQYEFNIVREDSKSLRLRQSSIYQIKYMKNDSVVSLKPEILEVQRDNTPILSTNLRENRHEIEWKDLQKNFNFNLNIKDDYGIVSSDIVMTLSRGDGESVRFREMKQAVSGISKRLRAQQIDISLPLDTFALEPGDELYFYLSATDNKEPKGNTGRTDVYFLSIADTAKSEPVAYEGFALTNEAEYFKSQRQIIIDTEKLLVDQNRITEAEFEQRSNAIGADQKVLRLRYGVFLGEEYETKGGLGEIDHSGHDHGTIEDENKDNDEGEQDNHESHDHAAENNFSNPIYNETPELEAYVHAHNESELSTFLDAEVKAKLKEALANMWEAELFLRTYKPKEALPFEYKALNLIKEVKRASRIYVERMGFEPPPIDEEKKRLTGELGEIDAQTTKDEKEQKLFEEKLVNTYSELKSAFQKQNTNEAVKLLNSFVDDLVNEITSKPVRYGKLLTAIKEYQSSESQRDLQSVIVIMDDMLNVMDLDRGNTSQTIQTTLHKTYYDLIDD